MKTARTKLDNALLKIEMIAGDFPAEKPEAVRHFDILGRLATDLADQLERKVEPILPSDYKIPGIPDDTDYTNKDDELSYLDGGGRRRWLTPAQKARREGMP